MKRAVAFVVIIFALAGYTGWTVHEAITGPLKVALG
jgi:hypothetical protein